MYFGDSITVLSVLSPGDGAYKKQIPNLLSHFIHKK